MIGALIAALAFPPQPGGTPPAPEPEAREEVTGPDDWLEKFPGPQDGFMLRLQSLCGGERYAGRVVSDDTRDADMRGERLVMGPADCTLADGRLEAIAIPFAVGEDASRTWLVSRTPSGLKLRHRHVLPDGTPDPVSGYGGVAEGGGTFTRQAFPADTGTRALFTREGLDESVANVWTLSVVPGDSFAYALDRPDANEGDAGEGGRAFRAEFDLMRPLPPRADEDDQAAFANP